MTGWILRTTAAEDPPAETVYTSGSEPRTKRS
jgi:hypothetical protein